MNVHRFVGLAGQDGLWKSFSFNFVFDLKKKNDIDLKAYRYVALGKLLGFFEQFSHLK